MASEAYPFLNDPTDSTSEIITIADGDFFTNGLPITEDEAEVYFEFFSDASANTPVTPTAGTIVTAGRPMEHNYLAASSNATTQASECGTPNSAYTPPILDGKMNRSRITLSGITGATHMKAQVFKHV